jgi:hypothetical protein
MLKKTKKRVKVEGFADNSKASKQKNAYRFIKNLQPISVSV